MDKKKLMGLVFSLALFAACSSEEGAGVTTEPAGDLDTRLSVLPGEPTAEQKAIMDSILNTLDNGRSFVERTNDIKLDSNKVVFKDSTGEIGIEATATNVILLIDSVPTGHYFKASGEKYYSHRKCNVTLYGEESGTQMFYTGGNGWYMETSLLLAKDEVMVEKIRNGYAPENQEGCEADRAAFQLRCASYNGVYKDYNGENGCKRFVLQNACAIPLFGQVITPEILTQEAENYYKVRCDSVVTREGPDTLAAGGMPNSATECYSVCENSLGGKCETVCFDMEGENEHFNVQDDEEGPFDAQESESASSSEMPDLSGCASVHMSYRECEDNLDSMCSYLTCLDENGNPLPLSNTQGDVSTSSASMPEAMSSASVDVTMSATSMESCYSVCENSLNGKCYTVCPDMDGEDGYFNVQDDEDEPFDAQGGVTMSSASMPFPVTSASMPEAMSSASMPY